MGYGVVNVTPTVTLIIRNNTNRKILWLTNASSNSTVALGPDSSMSTLNAGSMLYPYQGWESKKDFGDYKGDIYGATLDSVGSAKVFYWEVV